MMTTSNSRTSGSIVAPTAVASSRSLGASSVVPFGKHHEGELRSVSRGVDQLAAALRVGEDERERDGTAPQHVSQLVGAAGPGVGDDTHRVRRDPSRVRPLEQGRRHRLMEKLIRWERGPDHVALDLPPCHGPEKHLARETVAPAAPLDQQAALRLRVKLPHAAQELAAARPGELLRREHERSLFARGRRRLELRPRLLRRGDTHDPIRPRVAVGQLPLDDAQRLSILVDGEKDGDGRFHGARIISRAGKRPRMSPRSSEWAPRDAHRASRICTSHSAAAVAMRGSTPSSST